jgi:hypothetical protein
MDLQRFDHLAKSLAVLVPPWRAPSRWRRGLGRLAGLGRAARGPSAAQGTGQLV